MHLTAADFEADLLQGHDLAEGLANLVDDDGLVEVLSA